MCLHHLVPVPSFSLCLSHASPSLFNSLSCLLSLHSSFISSFTFHVVAFSPFTKTATNCHYLGYLRPNELCFKRELKGGHLGIISNVNNVWNIYVFRYYLLFVGKMFNAAVNMFWCGMCIWTILAHFHFKERWKMDYLIWWKRDINWW